MQATIKDVTRPIDDRSGDDYTIETVPAGVREAIETAARDGLIRGETTESGRAYRWVLDAESTRDLLGLTGAEIEAAGGSIWVAEFRRRTAGMTPEQIDQRFAGIDPAAVLED